MNNREFEWCGYHWRTQERWGDRHPDHPKQVRDGRCVKENKDGSLALFIFKNEDGDYSTGMISCIEKLGYGKYELDVIMPEGDNLWPSFWTWSYDSWPPEIDIFEGYSENDNYGEGKLLHDIEPNIHIGDCSANHKTVGAHETPALCTMNLTSQFNHFSCIYKPNSISIFYNHIPVYYKCSKKIMKWFNEHELQNVIINTGVSKAFTDDMLKTLGSPMIIKNFKYTPLK